MLSQEKILINRSMGPEDNRQGLFKLVLHGKIAEQAQPGQFVTIRTATTYDPLLRRPLSVAGIDRKAGEITLYYRVKGQGTALLSQQPEGGYLDVLGPLGKGFSLADPSSELAMPDEVLLVAGGIGIFNLYSLLEYLLKNNLIERIPVSIIWGGIDKDFLACATTDLLFQLPKNSIIMCTMDGSYGHKGLVTEPLEQLLSASKGKNTLVAACGPKVMLQAVAEMCGRFYVRSEVCLEEYMACGVGACRGCICQVKDQEGAVRHGRVCVEGPVFSGEEVVWHDRI